ncbi:MAG: malto-oligosyltrehalose trehalohydrolase [Sphingobacteriales bacterium]|nr:MAG: malto-oligosyltrehalose trehalohydrolase [Sphingobacteriales bacterium]
MNEAIVAKRTLGVYFENGKAVVSLWAPEKKEAVLLTGNNEKLALSKDEFGYWKGVAPNLKHGDEYRFVLDGAKPLPDPVSLLQKDSVHDASTAFDTDSFGWTDHAWNNNDLKDYIIYELHTGTFSEDGTFDGIREKLDYLVDLGVTAIEIMPVAQFPGSRNWGYDGVYPFAAQNSYGGPEGLQKLVNACHEKGIAVILDVVYNHMGPEGNYLNEYGPYFTDKYQTPWGRALNFDDSWCDGVRRFFVENVLMWFRDFHIDALRMDAVHAIKDFSPAHILREIRERVNELMAETGRRHYLIIECDLNDTRFLDAEEKGGFAMDSQWIDEFHHALRVTAGEERTGYYSDFDGLQHLAKAYKDAYVYDGQYSPHRHKKFGVKTSNSGEQFIVFSQNHDQVGNRMLGERTSQLVSFEMQKLMAGAVLVSPFLPMLFMGEEYSEPNPFMYFISHTDKDLVEAVRKGRKAEFAAFHAKGEAPDPQATETFMSCKLQWELVKQGKHQQMHHYYKTLLNLRKEHPVLRSRSRGNLEVQTDAEQQTLVLRRWEGEIHLLCLMNFSSAPKEVEVPDSEKPWNLMLSSSSAEYGGSETNIPVIEKAKSLTLHPESITLFTNQ